MLITTASIFIKIYFYIKYFLPYGVVFNNGVELSCQCKKWYHVLAVAVTVTSAPYGYDPSPTNRSTCASPLKYTL